MSWRITHTVVVTWDPAEPPGQTLVASIGSRKVTIGEAVLWRSWKPILRYPSFHLLVLASASVRTIGTKTSLVVNLSLPLKDRMISQ